VYDVSICVQDFVNVRAMDDCSRFLPWSSKISLLLVYFSPSEKHDRVKAENFEPIFLLSHRHLHRIS
jgi:hypothetical protein